MDARANEDAIYAALTTTVTVKVASGTGMVGMNDMSSDNHVVGGELEQVARLCHVPARGERQGVMSCSGQVA